MAWPSVSVLAVGVLIPVFDVQKVANRKREVVATRSMVAMVEEVANKDIISCFLHSDTTMWKINQH